MGIKLLPKQAILEVYFKRQRIGPADEVELFAREIEAMCIQEVVFLMESLNIDVNAALAKLAIDDG